MHEDGEEPGQARGKGPRAGLGFAAVLLTAGCAAAAGVGPGGGGEAGPRAELLSDWRPPDGQVCTVASSPEVLPTPDALVDRAGLALALDSAFQGEVPRGRVLLSLRQDSVGSWTRVAPIEGSHRAPTLDRLAAVVGPLLTDDRIGNVRLLVETGADAGLRLAVGRQEACSPEIWNRRFVSAELNRIWQQYRVEARLVVRVEVDTEGRVLGGVLVQPSGHAAVDSAVSRLLLNINFHPALSDRIPVATFNQFPLLIRGSG
jgi:TonB family protein